MKTVTCDLCGVEGARGDQPGEGKIVPCGGETFGGRLPAHGQVCDDCADEASEAASRVGRPPLNPSGGKTTPSRIRLSDANLEEVGRLIGEGRGKNVSEVVRSLLNESAAKRK